MRFFRIGVSCVAALVLAANVTAQSTDSTWVNDLLPPEARTIEIADVNVRGGTTRALLLWMLRPSRVLRGDRSAFHTTGGCADWIYGDHWYGPTRLSLLDLTNKRIINTIEIRGMYEGADGGFPVPFLVQNGPYYVRQIYGNQEGLPTIPNLRDLTGEGVAGQFVLFEYEACSISLTTVVGYSPRSYRAVQYRVETRAAGDQREAATWVEQVFGAKPVRPGHWDFTWEPGHGVEGRVHEKVTFDSAKQVFVRE